MKKSKIVKDYILDLLSDGKEHSTVEIKDYILSRGLKIEESSTLIRNVLFKLKNDDCIIINTSRGMYRLKQDAEESCYVELKRSISVIEQELLQLKKFNWLTCNDVQLNVARTKAQMLINLSSVINKELGL